MGEERSNEYYQSLIKELIALPAETEWFEFKKNRMVPEEVGEYISALSNSAALVGKAFSYMVWGIDDTTHAVVGTDFAPGEERVGNEELESWLLRSLTPKVHFRFITIQLSEKSVVILEISRAMGTPVQFKSNEYIRVGSYKKRLKDHSQKERELWRIFDKVPFEEVLAMENVSQETVLKLLDYPSYFELLNLDLPEQKQILERFEADRMVVKGHAGKWNITNLGAILFAKKLDEFKHLKRKAVRVIVYQGNQRIKTEREQIGFKGYASGFEGLIQFVDNLIPRNEVIEKALRKDVSMYPELAVRELVANAIIHQDFSLTGTGPMIEIFSNRIEITNPGIPLVKTERFIDSPPRSRNEILASFMRRAGICEERGSGIDKVVSLTEFYQLPPPVFEVSEEHMKVILFAHRAFSKMDKEEKVRACYLHACLKHVSRECLTNTSLRERFGLTESSSATASRIIRDSLAAGLIKPHNPESSPKYLKYMPFWA